ncbi:MAG: hypothetical protein EXS10_07590 [Phycisphaerales bacterium]|nr:hypothetical protein [Phycisphaerales bacterium]
MRRAEPRSRARALRATTSPIHSIPFHTPSLTHANPLARLKENRGSSDRLIAIGTSTGGTEALRVVLSALTIDTPGIVMVQHMPEGFTKAFADRLNTLCAIEVKEAEDGDAIRVGRALLAPGNRHMRVARDGARWIVRVSDGPRVMRHKPSVEVLFESAAQRLVAEPFVAVPAA